MMRRQPKFHGHFGCRRIIHKADARGIETEQLLEGQETVPLDQDLVAIPVPGHTRGHVVLLYRDKYLFTGDHLAWSDGRRGLVAFRSVAWYSWREQTQSMKRLLDYRFEWVLPGHGRRTYQPSDVMHRKLIECVQWMEGVARKKIYENNQTNFRGSADRAARSAGRLRPS